MVVLYDRDCGFCAWMLTGLLRWDRGRRLRPAPIQGAEGDARLAGMTPADRLASWHAVDADGRVFSGGAALTEVLRWLPGGAARPRNRARAATDRARLRVRGHQPADPRPSAAATRHRAGARIDRRARRPARPRSGDDAGGDVRGRPGAK
jgi:predicted DCC family thiol-disulfide oxidoreductase YuxK